MSSSGRLCRLALSGIAALAVGCQTAPPGRTVEGSSELSAGTPDNGDPAVVALVFARDPTELRCTGTLINERVVLTAAHCDIQLDPAAFEVVFGADLSGSVDRVEIIDVLAHPDYDSTASHDLALLLLAVPVQTAPVSLLNQPLIAAPPPVSLRLVGFGSSAPDAMDNGQKREGWTETSAVTDHYVELGAAPSLPCHGDSGGPVFATVGPDEALAAVVSRGDAACSAYTKATRVDTHLESFIEPFLAATAPGSAALGEPCVYDQQCEGGRCIQALDEPSLRFCSRPCAGDDDCVAPLVCEDALCRFRLPSPGATGSPCGSDGDCLRGECLDEGVCSVRCVSGRGDCPDGYECVYLGSVDFFCAAAPTPGCGCNSTGAPGSALLLLLACALVLARRSSRDRPDSSR